MELLKLSDLIVSEERQRKYFDVMKIDDLAEDIQKVGLLHAIVVQKDSPILIAGERRTKAIEQIYRTGGSFEYNGQTVPEGLIPVTRVGEKDAIQLYEAELSENLLREDLSWQERSNAVAQLHALRSMQTNGAQTLSDTASEVKGGKAQGGDITGIREDIVLAQHFDDEDIKKAKSKTEAVKILKKKLADEQNRALAEKYLSQKESKSPHQILQGDSILTLRTLPEKSFDVICTDPPYGIGANTFGDQTFINHEYDDSFETWTDLMEAFAVEAYRIAKAEAHAYVFCDPRHFDRLGDYMSAAGWYIWPQALIWDKGNVGTLPRPEHGPRRCYESILYAIKGDKKVTGVYHDVGRIPATAKPRHAAEKPVDLYVELLKRSVAPGDSIIDPFAGSGPIFPAANRLNCRATGIELVEANVGICSSRMEEI